MFKYICGNIYLDELQPRLVLVNGVEVRLRHLLQFVAHVFEPPVVRCVKI